MCRKQLIDSLVACALACAVACGGDGAKSTPESGNSITLAHPTFIVDKTNVGQLTALSADYSTFSVPVGPSTDALTEVGNTVIFGVTSQTPYGKALKVTNTSTSGGVVTVQTTPATMTDVFSSAQVAVNFAIDALSKVDMSRTSLASGVTVKTTDPLGTLGSSQTQSDDGVYGSKAQKSGFYIGLNNYTLAAQDSDGFSGSVVINANLFISANPELNFHFDTSGLHEFTIGATFDEATNASLDVTGNINWSDQIELSKVYLTPITIVIPAGPLTVPLVFNPYISLTAGGQFTANASVHASAGEEFSMDAKFGWINGGFSGDFVPNLTTNFVPPYFDQANANMKFTIGAQAGIELYASPGVAVGVDGYLALAADKSANPCFNLTAGVEAATSEHLSIFGIKIADGQQNITIPGGSVTLLTGVCNSTTGGLAETLDAPGTLWGYQEEKADNLQAPVHASMTADHGLLLARERNSGSYIARLDSAGKVLWVKTQEATGALGVTLMDPTAIQEQHDGSIAVLYGSAYPDQVLMNLNPNATPISANKYTFATGNSVGFTQFAQTPDWGLVLIGKGSLLGASSVSDYATVMRLNASGQVVWAKQIVGSATNTDAYLASVALSATDNTVVVSGYETGFNGDTASRLWVAKLGLDGSVVWSNVYHDVVNDISAHTPGAIAMAPDGSIIVGGSFQYASSTVFTDSPYVMKLDTSGKVLWVQATDDSAWVNGVTFTSAGDVVLTGQSPSGYASSTQNLWRARFGGTSGIEQWSMVYDISPQLGRFDSTFEVAGGDLMTVGFRADTTPISELLLMTTVGTGTSTLSAASNMTASNLSGNVVTFAENTASLGLSLNDLTVQQSSVPLQSSSGAAIPVFQDISGIVQHIYSP